MVEIFNKDKVFIHQTDSNIQMVNEIKPKEDTDINKIDREAVIENINKSILEEETTKHNKPRHKSNFDCFTYRKNTVHNPNK